MAFEWDPAKRRANLNKHGVDFADAVAVFEDPLALSRPDADVRGEARFVVLGVIALGRHLAVAFTERGPRHPLDLCPTGVKEGAKIL